jgi:hypothetical protein
MKRINPLLLLIALAVLVVAGIVMKTLSAKDCVDRGGVVAGPMTRAQYCVDR